MAEAIRLGRIPASKLSFYHFHRAELLREKGSLFGVVRDAHLRLARGVKAATLLYPS